MELPKSRYLKILKSQSNSSITYHGYKTNRKWYEVQKNLVAGTYAVRLMMYLRIGENFQIQGQILSPQKAERHFMQMRAQRAAQNRELLNRMQKG